MVDPIAFGNMASQQHIVWQECVAEENVHLISEPERNYDPSIPLTGLLIINIKVPTNPCLFKVFLIYHSTKLIINPLIYVHV